MVADDDGRIRLDDGTWVDVGPDGRWRPSAGERARAAVILVVLATFLGALVLVASVGGDDEGDGEEVAATSTTESTTSTTTTTAPPDPSSLDGEPASARCSVDDRAALAIRDRLATTVLVLNGTSRGGHAGDTTARLESLGYATADPGNADRRPVTAVTYELGFCAEAERLAADLGLPGASIEPVPDDLPVVVGRARLVVLLGADSV